MSELIMRQAAKKRYCTLLMSLSIRFVCVCVNFSLHSSLSDILVFWRRSLPTRGTNKAGLAHA